MVNFDYTPWFCVHDTCRMPEQCAAAQKVQALDDREEPVQVLMEARHFGRRWERELLRESDICRTRS